MVIDTTSREGMESALAHLMGVSVPELYQYIEAAADSAVEGQWCFNQDLFDEAMENFYSDMIEQELPDEILFFHLSRRLKGSENEISYNLQELLTSNNSFSEFLNAHQITFRKGVGNRIILCYRDRQIIRSLPTSRTRIRSSGTSPTRFPVCSFMRQQTKRSSRTTATR